MIDIQRTHSAPAKPHLHPNMQAALNGQRMMLQDAHIPKVECTGLRRILAHEQYTRHVQHVLIILHRQKDRSIYGLAEKMGNDRVQCFDVVPGSQRDQRSSPGRSPATHTTLALKVNQKQQKHRTRCPCSAFVRDPTEGVTDTRVRLSSDIWTSWTQPSRLTDEQMDTIHLEPRYVVIRSEGTGTLISCSYSIVCRHASNIKVESPNFLPHDA
ncbi:hypothetical protein FB567DRAFT_16332 [Paraphoma chrysanthemicola]|uniref:Uncharacterized protein n=1 Tax=Paraphoma chrysanthemicola TaxID=798071 RepID=A0A8K0RF68_9PLEO|nr:hypothetical protein FB567DRAFT_16332 [Paraphoma chrysanthemicola]